MANHAEACRCRPDGSGLQAEVSSPLHDALRFLTCDRWQIAFEPRKTSALVPHPGNFNLPDDTSVIIPFSDGLDSHAMAGLMKLEHSHKYNSVG